MTGELDKVSIRPGITILSVLKHLNYKPYYALAEFVDNAIDSYLKNKKFLEESNNGNFQLKVDIEFNSHDNFILIRDNAAGISKNDFPRAFRAAQIPPDRTLLSEFGMGMKSASCWFSNEWEVRTKALGEPFEKTVRFNIEDIVNDKVEELDITSKKIDSNLHYTIIKLIGVDEKMPVKRGLGKVKRHLASIYREFLRSNQLELRINNELQQYNTPKILIAEYHEQPNKPVGEKILWKQEISETFGKNISGNELKVSGFIALMDKMSVKNSGLALFRRGRVIEGSADSDEGFRPSQILGSLGSHRYKRLFGELHLEGFQVSHTKDGFQWDDNLEVFLDLLKDQLNHEDNLPILKQADNYRVRTSEKDLRDVSKKVVENTTTSIEKNIVSEINSARSNNSHTSNTGQLSEIKKSYFKSFIIDLHNVAWKVHIELSYDETLENLIEVGDHFIPNGKSNNGMREIGLRLSLVHKFMITFAGDNQNIIEPLLRFTVALGLSEVIAREVSAPVSEIRKSMNRLLKGSLSN